MSAEDDIAALLLALHDGPSSASTSPTQALKPAPLPATDSQPAAATAPSPLAAPSPSPAPALAFPGSFVVQPANPPAQQQQQPTASSSSTVRRATSPSANPSARYLPPSLPAPPASSSGGGPASSSTRGSSGPYDPYYAAAGPSTPSGSGTSLPSFQSLELDGQAHGAGGGYHASSGASYYGQTSYYPPPPPSHHYGPQPPYATGPSSSGYLSLPPRDPNIHPLLQQQPAPQAPPRPPNSPGQSSDIEPADEDDDHKPAVAKPPPAPLTAIPEAAAAAVPAKKRKRASGVGKESRSKGKGKAATAAAAAAAAATAAAAAAVSPAAPPHPMSTIGAAVAGAAQGTHILDPDSGIIRCICESIEDDGFTIQCDHCFAWNHIVCLGIGPSAVPDIYICPVCAPRPVDVPAAKEAQRQWREKAARLAADEYARELAARAREAAEAQAGAPGGPPPPPLALSPSVPATAGAAGSSPTTAVSPLIPAPAEKPVVKPRRKTGHNQHTAARDAREREAAALLLQQQQQADGSAPLMPAPSASTVNGAGLVGASTPAPTAPKRKSNALLRDILSSSTPAANPQQQQPQTPRPHPTSIDISVRAGGGSFSHAGSPAPSRSGTDDGLDDEGRLEAWMLEYVDVKECIIRDAKIRRALERVRERWVAEIPPPPPPPHKIEPPAPSVESEAKETVEAKAPEEAAAVDDSAMDVDHAPKAGTAAPADVPPPTTDAADAAPVAAAVVAEAPATGSAPSDPTADAPTVPLPAPPPPPPVAAAPLPPPSPPKWTGPKATFGVLDPYLPPVYLFGPSLAALSSSTSVKVLPDSAAAPPQTFTASHPTITTSLLRPVYPRPSMYGLYADNPIRKGDLIGEVAGEVLAGELYRNDPINQYRSLGVPKPGVRALGAPLNVVIDQRGFGNETRFARNGCHPNAVVRPIVFTKTAPAAVAGSDEARIGEPTLLLGLFANREIRGREEISVPWDWDDEHIVHALQPILQAALKSPSSSSLPGLAGYLQPKFAGVLTHLSSVFYTCVCTSKKDCSLAQMARVAEGKMLLGLADKSGGSSRSARRQKRPDLGLLVGALRGWRDEEKRRAALAQETIDRIMAERAAAAALRKAEALEAGGPVDDFDMDDANDHSIRISPDDVDMDDADEHDGNLSDASTLTEPMSHFSSDPESDEDEDAAGPQRPSSPADPRTPQRSPSLSPPPLLRTPPAAKSKAGVRRRPNNRVESESPPSSPPPARPVVATPPPPATQQQPKTSDPDSPLSDVPDSSPVLSDAAAARSSPPKLSLSMPSTLFAVDEEMSAPPVVEAPAAVAPPPPATAPPAKEPTPPPKEPTPPPKEPTPPPKEPTPPPKPPTPPPPVKRMSLKDWAKRRKEAVPTPAATPEEPVLSAPPLAAPESVPTTPVNEPQALAWGQPAASTHSSPTQQTNPSARFAPHLMAPPPMPTPAAAPEQQAQSPPPPPPPQTSSSMLPSFARRTDPQPPSPSAAAPARAVDPHPYAPTTYPPAPAPFAPPPAAYSPAPAPGPSPGAGTVDGPPTAASPFPPHRPSFGPPPAFANGPAPTRGGFGSPAMRGGRGGLPFAPPSGPRSGMAPPTGPRGFTGPFRGRGRGGADFVPRAPRSMAAEDLPRGGGVSDRAPPPSWMDARDDRDRPELGPPSGSAASGGGSVVHPPFGSPMGGGAPGGGGGPPRGGGYGGRGRGGFLPRGGGGWGPAR